MRRLLAAFVVLGLGGAAHAEDLIYVEALGKGGAYGLGYENALDERFSLGIAASFVSVSGQQVYTAAPYLHAKLKHVEHDIGDKTLESMTD